MSAETTTRAMPPVVELSGWQQALAEQHQLEHDLSQQAKRVAAARRRLPMTPVHGTYTFVGPEGEVSFAELFDGKQQLVVYHFMFGPDWDVGCPSCTRYMNELGNRFSAYIGERDTRFVLVSRAAYDKLADYATANGIEAPWYSCSPAFSEEMGAVNENGSDVPGFTTFFRDDTSIYRTYRPDYYGEPPVTGDLILHLTPWGMQVKDDDSPEGWPQSFNEEY